ncbi:MAG: universal stress protein [Nitrososphaerota archaeon]
MMRSEFESIFTNIKETESQCIDFKSEVIVTPASIVTGIVEYKEQNDANTIILGNGGLSTPKKMMLGSVACGVTICSSCPVLIIK